MNPNEFKQAVAQTAARYVVEKVPTGSVIGVGTGSTANLFIDALAPHMSSYRGAIASSEATRQRLENHGVKVLDLNEVDTLPIYVDGADEIDSELSMIKGGGGALTREKIVAAVADVFVCIADASKRVETLGKFPLPIEVLPMARAQIARALTSLGGKPVLREGFVTDNGNQILDVHNLTISDPRTLESTINQWPGVVTNGLFALRGADILLLAGEEGVQTFYRKQAPARQP